MQQFVITGLDPAEVIKKNNNFMKKLDPKQFYNTTLNPLIVEDITEETVKGKTTITKRTYKYNFTAVTTYFTPEDIPKDKAPNYHTG